jgi:hypothetical protein
MPPSLLPSRRNSAQQADDVARGPVAEEPAEAAVTSRHAHHPGSILAHAPDLRAMSDGAWIGEQILDLTVFEAGDYFGAEACERFLHRRPLVLDDLPDEAGAEHLLGQSREKKLVGGLSESCSGTGPR